MYQEEYQAAGKAAQAKAAFLEKNPVGYFLMAMMAGVYVGIGVLLTNTMGGQLEGSPFTKTLLGLSFGIALCLVVMAGAELFTGNNLVMTAGAIQKKVTWGQAAKLWGICWLGNFCGGLVLAVCYHFTELGKGAVGEFMGNAAVAKMTASVPALIARGILCNLLVCLAVWCGFRMKSESGKLMMIILCLFAFVTTGFEHCVANMTLFWVVLFRPCGTAVTLGGAAYNLFFVTIGNIIGGAVFLAVPYFLASRD